MGKQGFGIVIHCEQKTRFSDYIQEMMLKCRVVTKISSCQVNTTSRREIKHLGISLGSIFSSIFLLGVGGRGGTFMVAGGNPWPPTLHDCPEVNRLQ